MSQIFRCSHCQCEALRHSPVIRVARRPSGSDRRRMAEDVGLTSLPRSSPRRRWRRSGSNQRVLRLHAIPPFPASLWRTDNGGQGGIRTHGGRKPTAVFKTAALNHSATCPRADFHRGGGRKTQALFTARFPRRAQAEIRPPRPAFRPEYRPRTDRRASRCRQGWIHRPPQSCAGCGA